MFEPASGRLCWNTAATVYREGRPVLTLDGDSSIVAFQIFADYLVVNAQISASGDGLQDCEQFAVYHRKSGARVLDFLKPESFSFCIFELRPRLAVMVCQADASVCY